MKQIILLFACLFALQGLAKADDDRAITVDQLPQKAQEFIQKYFPGQNGKRLLGKEI